MVILLGFAAIVGVLTTRRLEGDFRVEMVQAADDLQATLRPRVVTVDENTRRLTTAVQIDDYGAGEGASIRLIFWDGGLIDATADSPNFGPPRQVSLERDGWRVETRAVRILNSPADTIYVQYARRLSVVRETAARVRVFLLLGVVGGTVLALIAGLATARRAMAPIAQLTLTARVVARTRDPATRLPHPESQDEVAELAATLEDMLAALDDAQMETEEMLTRQREFVADASHELRTPLTSVLANLELLEETLEGEQRDSAASALRSARRMRRLVADLLLLARKDTGRVPPQEAVDLAAVVRDAAGELEPVAGDHPLSVDAQPGATITGARDELHRLVLNLLENGLRHTDPGTAVEASVAREDGTVVLSVEDDGPGIPYEQREKIFERFYRGAGDRSGSSGLGLAIVRAVAESHHGSVRLEEPLDGRGARFVVRFPAR